MDGDQADKIAQFSAITGANPSTVGLYRLSTPQDNTDNTQAQGALESANWNLEEAASLYFAASEDPQHDRDEDDEEEQPQAIASAPAPATSSQSSRNQRRPPGQRPKQMTLQDLQRGDDEDDEEEDPDKKRDLFAGGEKSGLAVQDPSRGGRGPTDHFQNIVNQARQNRGRPGGDEDEQPSRPSAFSGRAQTLGGDEAPSTVIEDPTASAPGQQRLPRVTRTLHLWADGVSIDDGPLFRFDDPANQHIMDQINQGRAPLSLLDVQPDQEVDLNLDPHKDENYIKPKPKYKPFSGSGQRLGSPTPGPSGSTGVPSQQPAAAAAAATPASSSSSRTQTPAVTVDESAPIIQLQIRLGDGTQLRSRFNAAHTIGDVYDFVNRASATSTQRPYALMTTFPSKELSDKAQVLGEMSDFKRGGGVVVQKWT